VTFFGKPAWTALGAAELALKLGCAAVPAFIVPQEGGGHLVKIGPPILPPTGVPKAAQLAAVRDLTQLYTTAIEEQIRAYPYDWAWMHRRWNP
jgi:Kdo2-lipid IVA lauroyltransferase/acyltransferase